VSDLLALLYWCAAAALVGGLVAFIVPLRRSWLILPVIALALFVLIPMIPSRHETASSVASAGFVLALYILSWTAGVSAGSALRKRFWKRVRRFRAHFASPPLA
jgi:hypothetical protein